MKQYKRRIENLERAMNETIRVIIKRGDEPKKVLVMNRNRCPHLIYKRQPDEGANTFLQRAGCKQIRTND